MAVIDISSKLGKEKATIKLAEGKEFEVDTSADTYLVIQEKFSQQDFSIDSMYQMIETLMGEEALKEVKNMKLTINGLTSIVIAISAVVNEVPYEEMEKRFRDIKQ